MPSTEVTRNLRAKRYLDRLSISCFSRLPLTSKSILTKKSLGLSSFLFFVSDDAPNGSQNAVYYSFSTHLKRRFSVDKRASNPSTSDLLWFFLERHQSSASRFCIYRLIPPPFADAVFEMTALPSFITSSTVSSNFFSSTVTSSMFPFC